MRLRTFLITRFRLLFHKPNAAPLRGKHKGKGTKRKPKQLLSRRRLTNILQLAWIRIPVWVKAIVIPATLLITLLEGWPWLTVEKDVFLDPYNPYSELFVVVNTGYVPATHLTAECIVNFDMPNGGYIHNARSFSGEFASYLEHENRATLPCFRTIGGRISMNPGATLGISVTYAFPYLNVPLLRRSQTFKFSTVASPNGAVQWQYLG